MGGVQSRDFERLARQELRAALELPGAILALGGALVLVLVWQAATQRAYYVQRAIAASERKRKGELALELLRVRNSLMHSDESIRNGQHPEFALRWSDVVIVTYPKCGTTWMQGIVHALRSGCDMNFGEVTEEIPWDILALDCGQDLRAEQRFHPRVFKSHEPVATVAQGGRYIYVSREPADALLSFWRFLPSYAGLAEGDVALEGFARAVFAGVSVSGQIWHHMLGWWRLRAQPNVLWVCFEDLRADLPGEVARVADFLGLAAGPARDALVARVAAQSTLGAMSAPASAHHWDDHFVRAHVAPQMRLPRADGGLAGAASASAGERMAAAPRVGKVRADGGRVGQRLPATLRAQLDAKWAAIIGHETGLRDYAEMREALRRERRARAGGAAEEATRARGALKRE